MFAGLGNPGKRYEMTRHNIGFLVIDGFARINGIAMKEDNRLKAWTGRAILHGCEVHVVQPNTYMNESGQAVRLYMDYYKLSPHEVAVIADDADLPFGEVRLRSQGSAGGHNGLKSVELHLGTRLYSRLKMGIGREEDHGSKLRDFVLDPFSRPEFEKLPEFLNKGIKALELLLLEPVSNVMNKVNIKGK